MLWFTAAAPAADSAAKISPSATLALFAGIIGVVIGALLKGVIDWLQWRAGAKDRRDTADWDRVIEFVHCGSTLGAACYGLAMINKDKLVGLAPNQDDERQFSDQLNAEQLRLDRLRLEIVIRGPEWASTSAFDAVNAWRNVRSILHRTNDLETAAFGEFFPAMTDFEAANSKIVRLAAGKYKRAD